MVAVIGIMIVGILLIAFNAKAWSREPTQAGWNYGGCLYLIAAVVVILIFLAQIGLGE